MSKTLYPVKLNVRRAFLKSQNLEPILGSKHEKWSKPGLKRPVVFPTHGQGKKEIVPKIISTNLDTLGVSVEDFIKFVES